MSREWTLYGEVVGREISSSLAIPTPLVTYQAYANPHRKCTEERYKTISDATTVEVAFNSGTDASPTWPASGSGIQTGGSSGANELRFCDSGAGGASTASASWPGHARGASVAAIQELWAFSTNTSGIKVATYTGDNTKANVLRFHLTAELTAVSQPQFSFFATTALPTPTAGSQPSSPSTDGSGIVNGQSSDTSSSGYMKIVAYGPGIDSGGTQYTPSAGSIGTNPTGTTTNSVVTTATTGTWSNWTDGQGWISYILGGSTWDPLHAVLWYFSLILFSGPNLCLGSNIGPVLVLQYNYT